MNLSLKRVPKEKERENTGCVKLTREPLKLPVIPPNSGSDYNTRAILFAAQNCQFRHLRLS